MVNVLKLLGVEGSGEVETTDACGVERCEWLDCGEVLDLPTVTAGR